MHADEQRATSDFRLWEQQCSILYCYCSKVLWEENKRWLLKVKQALCVPQTKLLCHPTLLVLTLIIPRCVHSSLQISVSHSVEFLHVQN